MLLLVRGLPGTGKSTLGEMLGGSASFIHMEHVYGNIHDVPEAVIEKTRQRWEAAL